MFNCNNSTKYQNNTYYTNGLIKTILDSRISSMVSTSKEITIESFFRTFILSIIFLVIELIIFLIMRVLYKDIYRSKNMLHSERSIELPFFKFFMKRCSDFNDMTDLDGYLLLRFLKFLSFYFFTISLVHLPILLPLHYYYNNNMLGFSLDKFNVSNIHGKKMVIHLTLCLFDAIWFHFLILKESKIIFSIRKKRILQSKFSSILFIENINNTFLKNYQSLGNGYRVKDICEIHKDTRELYKTWNKVYRLEKYIERITLDIITEVYFEHRSKCFSLCEKRTTFFNFTFKFLKYIVYQKNYVLFKLRTSVVRLKCLLQICKYDNKVYNPINQNIELPSKFISNRYEQLEIALKIYNNTVVLLKKQNEKIEQEQRKNNSEREYVPKDAFVEFGSPKEAHAISLILSKNNVAFVSQVTLNPNPCDIQWLSVIYSNLIYKEIMRILSVIISISIVIGWVIPIAFVGFFAHIPYITVTFLQPLSFRIFKSKFIRDGIENILPLVTLTFLTELVPYVFRILSKLKGCRTGSEIEKDVQTWLFVFLFVHLFLVVTASSGISLVIDRLINNPNSIPIILAHELPKSSSFFCSFIMLRGISYFGGNILRIKDLLIQIIYYSFINYSPHIRINRIKNSLFFNWGSIYPLFSVLGCIGIVYGIISPIILPISCISLSLVYFSFKYLFEYQYTKKNHSDTFGELYQRTLLQLYVGIYFMEFCLLGLFVLSDSYRLALCTFCLFIATLICNIYVWKSMLRPILFHSDDHEQNTYIHNDDHQSTLDSYRSPMKRKTKMYGEIWLPTYRAESVIKEITVMEKKYGIMINTNKAFFDDCGNLHFR